MTFDPAACLPPGASVGTLFICELQATACAINNLGGGSVAQPAQFPSIGIVPGGPPFTITIDFDDAPTALAWGTAIQTPDQYVTVDGSTGGACPLGSPTGWMFASEQVSNVTILAGAVTFDYDPSVAVECDVGIDPGTAQALSVLAANTAADVPAVDACLAGGTEIFDDLDWTTNERQVTATTAVRELLACVDCSTAPPSILYFDVSSGAPVLTTIAPGNFPGECPADLSTQVDGEVLQWCEFLDSECVAGTIVNSSYLLPPGNFPGFTVGTAGNPHSVTINGDSDVASAVALAAQLAVPGTVVRIIGDAPNFGASAWFFPTAQVSNIVQLGADVTFDFDSTIAWGCDQSINPANGLTWAATSLQTTADLTAFNAATGGAQDNVVSQLDYGFITVTPGGSSVRTIIGCYDKTVVPPAVSYLDSAGNPTTRTPGTVLGVCDVELAIPDFADGELLRLCEFDQTSCTYQQSGPTCVGDVVPPNFPTIVGVPGGPPFTITVDFDGDAQCAATLFQALTFDPSNPGLIRLQVQGTNPCLAATPLDLWLPIQQLSNPTQLINAITFDWDSTLPFECQFATNPVTGNNVDTDVQASAADWAVVNACLGGATEIVDVQLDSTVYLAVPTAGAAPVRQLVQCWDKTTTPATVVDYFTLDGVQTTRTANTFLYGCETLGASVPSAQIDGETEIVCEYPENAATCSILLTAVQPTAIPPAAPTISLGGYPTSVTIDFDDVPSAVQFEAWLNGTPGIDVARLRQVGDGACTTTLYGWWFPVETVSNVSRLAGAVTFDFDPSVDVSCGEAVHPGSGIDLDTHVATTAADLLAFQACIGGVSSGVLLPLLNTELLVRSTVASGTASRSIIACYDKTTTPPTVSYTELDGTPTTLTPGTVLGRCIDPPAGLQFAVERAADRISSPGNCRLVLEETWVPSGGAPTIDVVGPFAGVYQVTINDPGGDITSLQGILSNTGPGCAFSFDFNGAGTLLSNGITGPVLSLAPSFFIDTNIGTLDVDSRCNPVPLDGTALGVVLAGLAGLGPQPLPAPLTNTIAVNCSNYLNGIDQYVPVQIVKTLDAATGAVLSQSLFDLDGNAYTQQGDLVDGVPDPAPQTLVPRGFQITGTAVTDLSPIGEVGIKSVTISVTAGAAIITDREGDPIRLPAGNTRTWTADDRGRLDLYGMTIAGDTAASTYDVIYENRV